MMDTRELIHERNQLNEQNKALLDAAEKREKGKQTLTAEERQAFEARSARIAELRGTLDAAAAHAAEERALGESRGRVTETRVGDGMEPTSAEQDLAFRGWALGRHATPEMVAAAQRCGVRIDLPHIDMAVRSVRLPDGSEKRTYLPVRTNTVGDIIEARALSVGTTTAGGNSVPNEVMRAFYEVQKWHGNVRALANVITTETGATLPWPTVTDTSNTGAILAEATTATTTADPTFGVVNLNAHKFSSKAVLVSWELLQDSFIDLSTYLGTALGRRIARIQNNKFTVGAGTTEPMGLVTAAAAGATGATDAFTLDNIITLIHSLDPAYRGLPGTAFMMHDTVASYVRKFKDSAGRYLWEMSNQIGQPDRLFGYPVHINNDMSSSVATGEKVVLFGNFGLAYLVRDAGAVRFVRSDEKYILEHQVMFEASQRSDGNCLDTTAIKRLTLA